MTADENDKPKQPRKPGRKPKAKRKLSKAQNKNASDCRSRKKRFLIAFSQTGVIQHAVRQVGISREVVTKWRKTDPKFAEDFQSAYEDSTERMEAEVVRRAVDGWQRPVYQKGFLCGYVTEFSDTLLMFKLRARKPQVYRDNATVEHAGKIGVTHGGQVAVTVTIQEAVEAMEQKYGSDLEALARSRLGVAVPGLSGAGNDGASALSGIHGPAARGSNGSNGNGHHKGTNGNGNGHH